MFALYKSTFYLLTYLLTRHSSGVRQLRPQTMTATRWSMTATATMATENENPRLISREIIFEVFQPL